MLRKTLGSLVVPLEEKGDGWSVFRPSSWQPIASLAAADLFHRKTLAQKAADMYRRRTSSFFVNSLLSGSFLINSSLSAPTKIEEQTAGSDEKHSAAPPGIDSQGPGFDSRRGCAVYFCLIRLSVLLSLSELKEKS